MQSRELRAMLEVAASFPPLTTGREVKRSQQDQGKTLGKPRPAEVRIEFEPKEGYSIEDVFAEVVALFQDGYWVDEKLDADPAELFGANLPQEGFRIDATVTLVPARSIVSVRLRSYLDPLSSPPNP